MLVSTFISLHNHFKYSKLDSMLNMEQAVKTAKSYGMEALAITDHGLVSGTIEFYNICKKHGIIPILGTEIYLTENRLLKSKKEMEEAGSEVYHLILYAMNEEGLANLYQIASEAANDGQFDGYERIDLGYIQTNGLGKGIICTSACIGGPISSWLIPKHKRQADRDRAKTWALDLSMVFEHFYIELSCNTSKDQILMNHELIELASELSMNIIISGDTHYLKRDDSNIHDVMLCINTNNIVSEPDRFRFPGDEFYLLKPEDVEDYCIRYSIPRIAMENTVMIAEMCKDLDPFPKDKKGLLPPFPVQQGYTEEYFLYEQCYNNLLDLQDRKGIDYIEYADRLSYELEIICSKGYAGYFLILWDLISFCRRDPIIWTEEFKMMWLSKGYPEDPISTGPGRGSAAGAMTSYLLGITKLDPIKYDLYFERFLNPSKDAFPDIDMDYEYLRREEVIDYILWKYGKENVAQIITYGTMKLKGGIRRIMKALEYTSTEQDEVAKAIPDKMPDQSDTEYAKFRDIMANPDKYKLEYGEDKFSSIYNKVKIFWDNMAKYPDVDTALAKLEGVVTSFSVHASGVVIAPPGKLKRSIPTKKFDSARLPVSQFEMAIIDAIKALKLDVLGLKTLSIIDLACKMAGIDKSILDTDEYDKYPEIYKMLRDGFTKQVFQCSSPGITRMIQDMELSNFEELIDALALFRPGPLTSKDENTGLTMVETYIQCKKTGVITSINPHIDHILAKTKGCLIYQEQLINVARVISGYTFGQADESIRKPVGKKKINEFPAIRNQFVNGDGIVPGALKMGFDVKTANAIFDMILCFGGYGFVRAHSACYAVIAWMTAYLKYFYPAEFMCAVMTVHSSDSEEVSDCIRECKKMGIDILPPNINYSQVGFSTEEYNGRKAIRYGLNALKGVGVPAAEEVIKYRPYQSFEEYMDRTHDPMVKRTDATGKKMNNPLNKRNEPIFILTGCFDELETNRHKLMNMYSTIRKDKDPKVFPEKKYDRKITLEYEMEYLGVYISDHPLKDYPFTRWNDIEDRGEVILGGIIRIIQVKTAANGGKYAVGTLETIEDKRRFMVFGHVYDKVAARLKKDARIVLIGTKNSDYENVQVKDVKTVIRKPKALTEIDEPVIVDFEDFEEAPV